MNSEKNKCYHFTIYYIYDKSLLHLQFKLVLKINRELLDEREEDCLGERTGGVINDVFWRHLLTRHRNMTSWRSEVERASSKAELNCIN